MTNASNMLRRVEITLWVVGFSLLVVALGATLQRWHYQAQQERELFQMIGAAGQTAAPIASENPDAVTVVALPDTVEGLPELPSGENAVTGAAIETEERDDVIVEDITSELDRLPVEVKPPAKAQRAPPAASDAFGRIEIPRIGVKAIVREGGDEKTLARAVGLIPGTGRPGELGNVVLAGHRDTFFRPLRKIKVDDRIRLVVPPETYEYRVESLRVVSPEETHVLDSHGVEELTLVTCYPFRFIGTAPDRFIVSATRVN